MEAETELIALVIIAKDQNLILKTKGEIYFLYSKKMSKDDPIGLCRAVSAGVMGMKIMGSEGDPLTPSWHLSHHLAPSIHALSSLPMFSMKGHVDTHGVPCLAH